MIIKPYVRDIADNIGLSILNEVKKMNINTLIVSCPFCLFHLLDVKKKYERKLLALKGVVGVFADVNRQVLVVLVEDPVNSLPRFRLLSALQVPK